MRLPRRRGSRTAWASTAVALLTGLLVAAPPALGRVHTKTCGHIERCAAAVPEPVALKTTNPQAPKGHFDLKITTGAASADKTGKIKDNGLVGREVSCRGYKLRSDTTLVFQLLTATPLKITYTVTETITNTTPAGIQFCLAASFRFKTASGEQAAPTRLPDGAPGHVGLLPPCAKVPGTGPCLEPVTTAPDLTNSTTKEDVIVKVRVPATTTGTDPWGGS